MAGETSIEQGIKLCLTKVTFCTVPNFGLQKKSYERFCRGFSYQLNIKVNLGRL